MEREYQTETASTSSNVETFGTRLRRLRTERQISQVSFARQLGVSKPTVWKWERDEVRPRPKSLEAAASILGVTERDLCAGRVTEPVRRLLAHQCERARHFYTAAAQAMPHADAHRLVAAEIMGGIYFEILQRIERRGFDVFTEVIRVPKAVRARIALSIWARGQLSALGYRLFSRA